MDANQFSTPVSGVTVHSLPSRVLATGKKLLPAVVAAMTTVGLVFPVQAQMVLEEVLVIAQKRTQNLQEVPVAVTAFSGEDLEISGIKDIFDLSKITPGLNVRPGISLKATSFRIRGIGTSALNLGLESSVGLYVDGVYRTRQSAMVNNMVDMASVEVLRGPQGTLFGRNTLAGAVLFNTAAPGHDGPEGFAEVTAGNYDLLNLSGATSISAIEDVLAFRASAFSSQRDGYVGDVNLGDDLLHDRDRWGARLQALYTPTDSLSVRIIADYSEIDELCCSTLVAQDNLRPVALPAGATPYAGSDEVVRSLGGTVFTADQFYNYETARNFPTIQENEDSGVSLTVEWELDAFTLTSVTGYRSYEFHARNDADFGDLDIFTAEGTTDLSAWSQELRISDEGENLSYVAGLYYFNQDIDHVETMAIGKDANDFYAHSSIYYGETKVQIPLEDISSLPKPSLPLFTPDTGTRDDMEQEQEAYAIFGQAEYYLTNELMLTAGLRYTREEKDMYSLFTDGSAPDFIDNVPVGILAQLPTFLPQDPVDESLSDEQVTGNIKLSWFINDAVMSYISYGTGYKSGGTNMNRINPEFDYVFGPETSEALEIGLKADFPEQALRLNVALHRTDIDDLQVEYLGADGFYLQNAGMAETYGGEVELTWFPTESLTITGAYAKTEGEFKEFENSFCWRAAPFHTGQPDPGDPSGGQDTVACDRSGEDLHNNPDLLVLTANQAFALSDGIDGFFLIEYSRLGEAESTYHDPFHTAPSYELLNLRLGFQLNDYDAALTFWGRNVLDEEYRSTGFDPIGSNGLVVAIPGEPATYGITLRKNF
jgi:outer membrane receptor protein involved in Fe transport